MYYPATHPIIPMLIPADTEECSYVGHTVRYDGSTKDFRKLYKLDWSCVDKNIDDERRECEKDDRPFCELFPHRLRSAVDAFRFCLTPMEAREVAWQAKRGVEEYDRPFPEDYVNVLETGDRDTCRNPAHGHFIAAFQILSWNIVHDNTVSTALGLDPEDDRCYGIVARALMLTRMWDEQTGGGLITCGDVLGLDVDSIKTKIKFFDKFFTDMDKRVEDARKLRIQARERKHGPIKDGEKVMA